MPYTVPVSFDRFFENINLGGTHRETANTRKDDVVAKLNKSFDILEAFSAGSIPKHTALRSHADLDVIVALHSSLDKAYKGQNPNTGFARRTNFRIRMENWRPPKRPGSHSFL